MKAKVTINVNENFLNIEVNRHFIVLYLRPERVWTLHYYRPSNTNSADLVERFDTIDAALKRARQLLKTKFNINSLELINLVWR